MKRPTAHLDLALALLLGSLLGGLSAPSRAAVVVDPEAGPADGARYDHFLYVRHDVKDGVAVTDTLVLVKVLPDRFALRAAGRF
jgi:hypothetical protein